MVKLGSLQLGSLPTLRRGQHHATAGYDPAPCPPPSSPSPTCSSASPRAIRRGSAWSRPTCASRRNLSGSSTGSSLPAASGSGTYPTSSRSPRSLRAPMKTRCTPTSPIACRWCWRRPRSRRCGRTSSGSRKRARSCSRCRRPPRRRAMRGRPRTSGASSTQSGTRAGTRTPKRSRAGPNATNGVPNVTTLPRRRGCPIALQGCSPNPA